MGLWGSASQKRNRANKFALFKLTLLCPREESNLELRLRSPQLYPFNYRGSVRAKGLEPLTYPV